MGRSNTPLNNAGRLLALECYEESSPRKLKTVGRMDCFLENGDYINGSPAILKIPVESDIVIGDTIIFYVSPVLNPNKNDL